MPSAVPQLERQQQVSRLLCPCSLSWPGAQASLSLIFPICQLRRVKASHPRSLAVDLNCEHCPEVQSGRDAHHRALGCTAKVWLERGWVTEEAWAVLHLCWRSQ